MIDDYLNDLNVIGYNEAELLTKKDYAIAKQMSRKLKKRTKIRGLGKVLFTWTV